jgi:hypothetical protein
MKIRVIFFPPLCSVMEYRIRNGAFTKLVPRTPKVELPKIEDTMNLDYSLFLDDESEVLLSSQESQLSQNDMLQTRFAPDQLLASKLFCAFLDKTGDNATLLALNNQFMSMLTSEFLDDKFHDLVYALREGKAEDLVNMHTEVDSCFPNFAWMDGSTADSVVKQFYFERFVIVTSRLHLLMCLFLPRAKKNLYKSMYEHLRRRLRDLRLCWKNMNLPSVWATEHTQDINYDLVDKLEKMACAAADVEDRLKRFLNFHVRVVPVHKIRALTQGRKLLLDLSFT